MYEISRETWVSMWLVIYLRWLSGWRKEGCLPYLDNYFARQWLIPTGTSRSPLTVIPSMPTHESEKGDQYHHFLDPHSLTIDLQIGKPKTPNNNTAEKIWDNFQKFHWLKFSLLPPTTNKPMTIEISTFIARENPTPPSCFREVQRTSISITLFSPIPPRNTEIHQNEESHTPTSL